jgi:hypothetical protein
MVVADMVYAARRWQHLLRGLLETDPDRRLGSGARAGLDLQDTDFFR